ncbi:MAG: tetratricopeptide repeat protein [Thermodesulfobacteriota bacterium]|nr:tetratricopeptide repeat protein [Thermodesulfobacteriota bacterium]
MTGVEKIFSNDTLFSAKELSFLKSDSKSSENRNQSLPQGSLKSPEMYLSDQLSPCTAGMDAFILKLSRADIHRDFFVCAVIKLHTRKTNPSARYHPVNEETKQFLDNFLSPTRGIWYSINLNHIALALWGGEKKTIEDHLFFIKKEIERTAQVTVSAGACWSVAELKLEKAQFSRQEIFHNAVKALDHGAFYGPGNLTFFDAVSLNISGDRLYQLGRIKEAALEYKKGLDLDSENTNLLNSQGVCFALMNQLDLALKAFEKAIDINPEEVMAVYNAGLACVVTQQMAKGLKYLQTASRLNSDIYEIDLTAGKLFTREQCFDEAEIHINRAARLRPDLSSPYRTLGDLFMAIKKFNRAEAAYKKAVKLNSSDAYALSGLARAYEIQNNNLDIALTFALESVDLEPDNPAFHRNLGRIYDKLKKNDLAEQSFEKSEKLKSASVSEENNETIHS